MTNFPEMDIAPFSPSTLVIDLDNLRHNLKYFRSLLSDHTRIMAMVKSDGYGCGAVEVCRVLQESGVEYLGVAYTREGINLRNHGIYASIMVMNVVPQDFPDLVKYRLEPELSSLFLLQKWVDFVITGNIVASPVHLEVDTGMKRLGLGDGDLAAVIDILKSSPAIQIKSIFSHLASSPAPEDDGFTMEQFNRFDSWCQALCSETNQSPLKHILNSPGVCRFPDHQYDMVRIGIGLYGVGLEILPAQKALKPVQSLYATISQVKDITAMETVGYGREGILPSSGRIATLNLGYADGLPRLAGNGNFSVRIGSRLCPVVGRVCMDMTMVDVSDCPDGIPGAPVEVYGPAHPVIHLADAAKTIPYEILTGNHHRVRRLIKNE